MAQALAFLHWLLGAGPQGQIILADLEALVTAQSGAARIDALAKLIQDFKPLVDSFPGLTALEPADEHKLLAHPAVGKNGQIISILIQNLPQILAFITQIIPLFGSGTTPTPTPTPAGA